MSVTRSRITCDAIITVRLPRQKGIGGRGKGWKVAPRGPVRHDRKCGADAVVRHHYYAGDLIVETKDYCRTHEGGDPQRETLAQRVVKLDL